MVGNKGTEGREDDVLTKVSPEALAAALRAALASMLKDNSWMSSVAEGQLAPTIVKATQTDAILEPEILTLIEALQARLAASDPAEIDLADDPPDRDDAEGTSAERAIALWAEECRRLASDESLSLIQNRALRRVADMGRRLDFATAYLYAALEQAGTASLDAPREANRPGKVAIGAALHIQFLAQMVTRYARVRSILTHDWTPPSAVYPLIDIACASLCEPLLTGEQIFGDLLRSPTRDLTPLVRHLDSYMHEASQALDDATTRRKSAAGGVVLSANKSAILARAGEGLSLSEAARRLGRTRQNVHKRIQSGSALGVRVGNEIVVPAIQFVGSESDTRIVDDLSDISQLFRDANVGPWELLGFMVRVDPNLQAVPIEVLKQGDTDRVVAATRAFLHLDEG